MKIKILSYLFDLILEPGFQNNKNGNNLPRNLGSISYTRHEIRVDPEHPENDGTVLHELVHAVAHFWSIDLKEEDVERLAEGLFHILKENKIDFSKENVFSENYFGDKI